MLHCSVPSSSAPSASPKLCDPTMAKKSPWQTCSSADWWSNSSESMGTTSTKRPPRPPSSLTSFAQARVPSHPSRKSSSAVPCVSSSKITATRMTSFERPGCAIRRGVGTGSPDPGVGSAVGAGSGVGVGGAGSDVAVTSSALDDRATGTCGSPHAVAASATVSRAQYAAAERRRIVSQCAMIFTVVAPPPSPRAPAIPETKFGAPPAITAGNTPDLRRRQPSSARNWFFTPMRRSESGDCRCHGCDPRRGD